jgi:hypothetical protein
VNPLSLRNGGSDAAALYGQKLIAFHSELRRLLLLRG